MKIDWEMLAVIAIGSLFGGCMIAIYLSYTWPR